MPLPTDDIRVEKIRELVPPSHLIREYPLVERASNIVSESRRAIHKILTKRDERLIVVVGPCSIHDPLAAREYAARLLRERERLADSLEIVMRVYFEKPRSTIGWKGLINDPNLDASFDVNKGLREARSLLHDLSLMGLPAGTEFLDPISPQYYSDLIAWGAIGARTSESQVHRELASGLSCPIGFKNGTDGNIKIAVDAIKAAEHPHCFMGVTKGGFSAIVHTVGNNDCHLILRGGKEPNYNTQSVQAACLALEKLGVSPRIMIDCSHANSQKNHERQVLVVQDIQTQLCNGESRITGVMIESNLISGRQDHSVEFGKAGLTYGQSITDACIGWDNTVEILEILASSVKSRSHFVQRGSHLSRERLSASLA